jgi:hypothetical protein
VTPNAARAGDVLLCYARELSDQLVEATGLAYSHAAICLGENLVAEAIRSGVRKVPLKELQEEYAHLVVLRQPDCWNEKRLQLLHRFVDEAVASKTKFNVDGIRQFEARREVHESTLTDKLEAFFAGEHPAPTGNSEHVYCSEFVASLFVRVGFLAPSAAIVFDPSVTSPAHLDDGVYGFFVGYLIPYEGYAIPPTDHFYHETPFKEVFKGPE